MMEKIRENIGIIRENIRAAALRSGHDEKDIILVGASKMNNSAACRAAIAAGIDALGENRVQEIKDGTFVELIEALMQKPIDEIKELYNTREIEK